MRNKLCLLFIFATLMLATVSIWSFAGEVENDDKPDVSECSNNIDYNISGWVMEEEKSTDVADTSKVMYEKTVAINSSFSIKNPEINIAKNSVMLTFVYDKDSVVYIKDNKIDCACNELLPKKYKVVSTNAIYRSPNQSIANADFILYEKFSFKERRRTDDASIDISCSPMGEVSFFGRGFEALNAAGKGSALSNIRVISDTTEKDKDNSSVRTVIVEKQSKNNDTKNDNNYKYVSGRIIKIYYDKNGECLAKGFVDLYFRYNKEYKECQCFGASFANCTYKSKYNLRTFAKSSNLSHFNGDGIAEFELKNGKSGGMKYNKAFIGCSSDGVLSTDKWVSTKEK